MSGFIAQMARTRTPVAKAEITGRTVHDAKRFVGRSNPKTRALGKPSRWMTKGQCEAWEAFRSELPWLTESDRSLVEIASCIRARLMAGQDVGVSALNQLRMCAAQMGATPADRSKVNIPDEEKTDPADEFLN